MRRVIATLTAFVAVAALAAVPGQAQGRPVAVAARPSAAYTPPPIAWHACTDDAIAAYLSTGVTPARRSGNRSDKVCPPVPQPNPLATSSVSPAASGADRAAPARGDVTVLRQVLAKAQLR